MFDTATASAMRALIATRSRSRRRTSARSSTRETFAFESRPDRPGGPCAAVSPHDQRTIDVVRRPRRAPATTACSRHAAWVRARQVVVTADQQPQHGRVVHRSHGPQPTVTQPGHRGRQRIVRSFFVRLRRSEQPHPSRQRRRHIHDVFTRRDELLRQQLAEPVRGLDRPGPLLTQRRGPRQQPWRLPPIRCHFERAERCSSPSIATAMCVALCGSIPMITVIRASS